MTYKEWLRSDNPTDMARYVYDNHTNTSPRRRRLAAVALCRTVGYASVKCRRAVECAERWVDLSGAAQQRARVVLRRHCDSNNGIITNLRRAAMWTSFVADEKDWVELPVIVMHMSTSRSDAPRLTDEVICAILRDTCATPPDPVQPDWITRDVRALASACYAERFADADRVGVLADACEDARVSDAVVEHLRGPGPHWRGCWAVDRLLGKE